MAGAGVCATCLCRRRPSLAASEVRSDFAIFGDTMDGRTISLAQALKAKIEPIRKAPDAWHIEIVGGRLELLGPEGLRFALNESVVVWRRHAELLGCREFWMH